jgi:hypothetical protein
VFSDRCNGFSGHYYPRESHGMSGSRRLIAGVHHFDATFVIYMGKLIHIAAIEVLHSYYIEARANLTIILHIRSDRGQ